MFALIVPGLVRPWLRRSRLAALLVCLSIVSLGSADWIAAVHGDDDPGCDAAPVAAFGVSPALHAAGGAASPHCPICHWLRSLRSLAADTVAVSIAAAEPGAVPAVGLPREVPVSAFHVPARSPPA